MSIFDVEVFADEEAERAEGAEDEQEEGGQELDVKIVLSVLCCGRNTEHRRRKRKY